MRILIGEPVKGTEANALRRLHQTAKDLDGLLLANFHVGPRQFDFVLVSPGYTALIELKSLAGAVFGGQNGNWSIRDLTGEKREYPGFNPWGQAVAQANVLSDEMSRFQKTHQNVPAPLNGQFYREFETIASIYPTLHPDSKIEITTFKANVVGFDDLTSTITSQRRARSWQVSDWERFAKESLSLKTVSLEEAIDPRMHRARTSVNSYLQRLRDSYNHDLAPLPATTAESIRGSILIHCLMESRHQILVGPSGSCKSFHLRHLVLSLAAGGNEVPIPVDPKGYGGGEISYLLQQSTSPFSALNVGKLVGDIVACGLRPVLVIDALNECPEAFRSRLLEKLQAFVLLRDARLIMSDQARVELPPEIKSTLISIQLPQGDEKVQIFSYYAGEPPSEGLAHLSRTFTNAFDLKIAGKSHARGDHPDSRWELYSRYVRDTLHGTYVVASAFLRAIAGEMMESLTMAVRQDRFEKLAETFYQQEQSPLAAVEQLLRSRLVLPRDEYIFFEHELLLDFFKTQYLTRKGEAADDFAAQLSRPRNAHLLEWALAECDSEAAIETLLAKADDPKTLGVALRGHCGPLAQTTVRKQCLVLIALGVAETSTIKLTCQTIERNDGKIGLVGFTITGTKPNPFPGMERFFVRWLQRISRTKRSDESS
ncbi:MAG TPA: nuclease-related domain-containing protein [Edaphobacter sp.]|nr:nuclease-related domain-containing protein [Edaphobacter sp.]